MADCSTDIRNRKAAFTLAELLVALTVIGILATLGVGSFWKARDTAWREKTRDTARQLAIAWNMRLVDDGQFPNFTPTTTNLPAGVTLPNIPNALVFAATAQNMEQVSVSSNNVQRRIYFEQNAAARASGLLDHWGHCFYVALDTSYTGTIASPTNTASYLHANVVVWSFGKTPSNPNAWIVAGQ